jgi:hypothetical protein
MSHTLEINSRDAGILATKVMGEMYRAGRYDDGNAIQGLIMLAAMLSKELAVAKHMLANAVEYALADPRQFENTIDKFLPKLIDEPATSETVNRIDATIRRHLASDIAGLPPADHPQPWPRHNCLQFVREHGGVHTQISKSAFDAKAKAKDFEIGPFRDSFGDGPGDPYNPNRQAFGTLKTGEVVWCELSEEKS